MALQAISLHSNFLRVVSCSPPERNTTCSRTYIRSSIPFPCMPTYLSLSAPCKVAISCLPSSGLSNPAIQWVATLPSPTKSKWQLREVSPLPSLSFFEYLPSVLGYPQNSLYILWLLYYSLRFYFTISLFNILCSLSSWTERHMNSQELNKVAVKYPRPMAFTPVYQKTCHRVHEDPVLVETISRSLIS